MVALATFYIYIISNIVIIILSSTGSMIATLLATSIFGWAKYNIKNSKIKKIIVINEIKVKDQTISQSILKLLSIEKQVTNQKLEWKRKNRNS